MKIYVDIDNTICNTLVDAKGTCLIPLDILNGTLSEFSLA